MFSYLVSCTYKCAVHVIVRSSPGYVYLIAARQLFHFAHYSVRVSVVNVSNYVFWQNTIWQSGELTVQACPFAPPVEFQLRTVSQVRLKSGRSVIFLLYYAYAFHILKV